MKSSYFNLKGFCSRGYFNSKYVFSLPDNSDSWIELFYFRRLFIRRCRWEKSPVPSKSCETVMLNTEGKKLPPYKRASSTVIKNFDEYIAAEKKRFPLYYEQKGAVTESKMEDFIRITTLGAGSFGRVMLVQRKGSDEYYAMKILEKKKVIAMEQVEHTLNEKKVLQSLNHPFIVYLVYYFIDNSYLYFVLPFINGGEMFGLLKKMKLFDEILSRFYAAQVCSGLEYLHHMELAYRDLKPENLLIDSTGYIKITDFGFSKIVRGRTYTLCGTPEYLAPEIVLTRGYNHAVDWWALGILIFEMNAGYAPFRHKDPMSLYDKIAAGNYKAPQHFSIGLRDLLRNLLQVDLSKRFGNMARGADDIKCHRWFKTINWFGLLNRKIDPPYKPETLSPRDTSNFDKFSDEPLVIAEKDKYASYFVDF